MKCALLWTIFTGIFVNVGSQSEAWSKVIEFTPCNRRMHWQAVHAGMHACTGEKVEFPELQYRAQFPIHFPEAFEYLS